jgi:phage regulator Rha-like protein
MKEEIVKKIAEQIRELKREQEQIKKVKEAEWAQQRQYIQNCQKVLALYREKRNDFTIESLIVMSETVRAIATDVQGFKSIRNRLFTQASQEKPDNENGKLYLYLFHLFESLVANIAVLI